MISKIVFTIALSISTLAAQAEYFDLSPQSFEAKAPAIYDRINDIINNPEPILQGYKPVGMKIKNKVISKNQIQFTATKEVLGFSKTVLYKGTLDIKYMTGVKNQNCFQAILDFTGSGDLIIENIENLEMIFCTKELGEDHLSATVKSKMLKGQNYGGLVSGIAKGLIADQLVPIIASVKAEIEK
ncbi:MAG: hypothetical protein K2Q18_00825 [Bdellovibrionales bacterium]|nr:hypothetical protein [Bdellovibrionales bacterium]